MRAIIEKTDSFGNTSRFIINGYDKRSCWDQMDMLQEMSVECGYKSYFDIIAWEENGVFRSVYDKSIVII